MPATLSWTGPSGSTPELPREIVLPSAKALEPFGGYERDNQVRYALNTAWYLHRTRWTGVQVREADDLKPVCWSAFPVLVDGVRVVLDFSDYLVLDPQALDAEHWLRFHYTSAFQPFHRLGCFPNQSFLDWDQYLALDTEIQQARFTATPDRILANQAPGPKWNSAARRRLLVRGFLHYYFSDWADFTWTEASVWWRKAPWAFCYVHIPGSTPNLIDRGWIQMLAFGVPIVSPPIHGYLGAGLPLPGVHYRVCRDDYADLGQQVTWCLEHPAEAAALGQMGRGFFQAQAFPTAIWAQVYRRLQGADPGPDCDLPAAAIECAARTPT